MRPLTFSPRRRAVAPTLVAAFIATSSLFAATDGYARSRGEPAAPKVANPQDPALIVISLRRQRLTVFNKDGQITNSPISSGNSEFPTVTGIFSVLGKEVEHESNIYEGASMPYMQRLTWSGTAMHAGNLPGYPASHGCIRLPYNFSQRLYGMTQINTRVIVTRDEPTPQPISHANLFVPLPPTPVEGTPMVSNVTSKVASLDGLTPTPAQLAVASQPSLSPKAKARFAETQRLFDEIKVTEAARGVVWDKVKAANRALEQVKTEINAQQTLIDDANREIEKAKRAKQVADGQLAAIMRKAEKARSPEAFEALTKDEDAAEARLIELGDKLDAALAVQAKFRADLAPIKLKLQTAETARRALDDDLKKSNLGLKNAQTAHSIAKREDARYMKPVSVLISRKDQRIYVRQGFEPVLEAPIMIDNPEQPLGTHVYTAMGVKKGGAAFDWHVVSLAAATKSEESRRNKAGVDARHATATKALDRVHFPAEALEAINDVVKSGSSLIISDEGTGPHFGNGTDFMVAVR
jgi:hypothetical protein